jgi:hypothetical protein
VAVALVPPSVDARTVNKGNHGQVTQTVQRGNSGSVTYSTGPITQRVDLAPGSTGNDVSITNSTASLYATQGDSDRGGGAHDR